jgi:hypothetical protein
LGREAGAEIETPTFLQGFQTLKCDLELVFVSELGGVVHDIDPEKRNDRHAEECVVWR